MAYAHHPWDEPQWMNRQHLLSRLGKRGWPVLYNNGALNIWHRNTQTWKCSSLFGETTQSDHVLLFNSGKIIPRWETSRLIDTLAIRAHNHQLRRTIGIIEKKSPYICMCFNPIFWPYVKLLNPPFLAFHAYDNYSRQPGWTIERENHLEQLTSHANLITASSEAIAHALPGKGPKKAKTLENGVDLGLFLQKELVCPADIKSIPHPRIIYTGTINRKVDIPLVVSIAKQKLEWHWVFVGRLELGELQEDDYFSKALEEINDLENIHFLGEKNKNEIPSYLLNVDVTTMCYRSDGDGWWLDISPLKLHEYLATGKPVIGAPLPSITKYSDVIDIAQSREEWICSLERAIHQGGLSTPDNRINVAQLNSWESRVDKLEQWLYELTATIPTPKIKE